MAIALTEATKGCGCTAPNPAVGAVLVKEGRVLSKGFHRAAGSPHAEIVAMRKVSQDQLTGSTLYVTLEPCSSHGRTPPCTEAILSAGISRVVYGATDPDKRHRGKAASIFRKAGIETQEGVLAEPCAALNFHWNHRNRTGLPWVIAKAALSLDGRIDSPPDRRWITSAASRREAMKLRASVEAILVGGGTVRTDNPALTVRGIKLPKGRQQPWRVIWTRSGKLSQNCKLLTDAQRDRTIILKGISLNSALRELARRGISSVLVEGGGKTLGEAFQESLVDEVRFFLAPLFQGGRVPVLGGLASPHVGLEAMTPSVIGSDLLISARVRKGPKSARGIAKGYREA
jgi:diaminohydroxyphosphoribosylaminopyrimidine deaminase / 5-amino-6-(5-phosphoribosylamino)uracil reductase